MFIFSSPDFANAIFSRQLKTVVIRVPMGKSSAFWRWRRFVDKQRFHCLGRCPWRPLSLSWLRGYLIGLPEFQLLWLVARQPFSRSELGGGGRGGVGRGERRSYCSVLLAPYCYVIANPLSLLRARSSLPPRSASRRFSSFLRVYAKGCSLFVSWR